MRTYKHFLPLAFLLGATSTNAQTTFAPLGAKWTYLERFAFSSDSAIFEIESVGDTVIQGHTSQLLETTGIIGCISTYRYVRSSNDTVYFWEPVTGSFQILFVADAVIGESWNTTVSSPSWEISEVRTASVTGTSTVTISGIPLRRLVVAYGSGAMFSLSPGPYITERLGGAYGLFPWQLSFCDGAYLVALRCYQDDEISWVNPQFAQCELSTGLQEQGPVALRLLPSIVRVGERIPLTSDGGTTMRVEAFDASGRALTDRRFQGSTELVFTSPGLHMVRLSDDRSRPLVKRVLAN
ncbi:MAG: hypothetical protein ABI432_19680 [Flavobacteriales bacterium]